MPYLSTFIMLQSQAMTELEMISIINSSRRMLCPTYCQVQSLETTSILMYTAGALAMHHATNSTLRRAPTNNLAYMHTIHWRHGSWWQLVRCIREMGYLGAAAPRQTPG